MTKRLTLVARFTLAGLCVSALIVAGLSWLLSLRMIEDALNTMTRETASTVTSALTSQVSPEDFTPNPSHAAAWRKRINRVIGTGDIARVRVWNADGQMVYSDDPALIGRTAQGEAQDPLREALKGHPVTDLSTARNPDNRDVPFFGRLVEIYVPAVLPGRSTVVGVYEVSRKAAPLEAQIDAIKRLVWGGSAAAFILLSASFLVLAGRVGRQISRQQDEVQAALIGVVQALARTVDAKESSSGTHSSQVAEYAVAIAKGLGLSKDEIDDIQMAAYLHDLGKIGIPDELLKKPGALTAAEKEQMRLHPMIAAQILEAVPLSSRIKLTVKHNHERWDGLGYPFGLKGEEIPIGARILCVADAYEAMTSDRPYRSAMDHPAAGEELQRNAGTQFDARVVDTFLRVLEEQRMEQPLRAQEGFSSPRPTPISPS